MYEKIKLSEIFGFHPYGTQRTGETPLLVLEKGQLIEIPELDDEEVFKVIEQRGIGIVTPSIDRNTLLQLVLEQLACFYQIHQKDDTTIAIGWRLNEEERNERWKTFFEKFEPFFEEFKFK